MSTQIKTNRSLSQQATRSETKIVLAWGVMFAVMLPAIIWGAITGDHALWWTATTIPTGILTVLALLLSWEPFGL